MMNHQGKFSQNSCYQGVLEENCTKPEKDSVVLGGNGPLAGAAVLGTGKIFGQLFDRFNQEAKPTNGTHLQLQLTVKVALIRNCRATPLDDIKIKVRVGKIWWFAGYLKHDGSLFGNTGKYDPARCEAKLRGIAHSALIRR